MKEIREVKIDIEKFEITLTVIALWLGPAQAFNNEPSIEIKCDFCSLNKLYNAPFEKGGSLRSRRGIFVGVKDFSPLLCNLIIFKRYKIKKSHEKLSMRHYEYIGEKKSPALHFAQ